MQVRVIAFAQLRELLGWSSRDLDLPDGSCGSDVWNLLASGSPAIAPLASSTRLARNGRVADRSETLRNGDEIALLPPVGGG
jgi:molybdopterin converting factor small subunit